VAKFRRLAARWHRTARGRQYRAWYMARYADGLHESDALFFQLSRAGSEEAYYAGLESSPTTLLNPSSDREESPSLRGLVKARHLTLDLDTNQAMEEIWSEYNSVIFCLQNLFPNSMGIVRSTTCICNISNSRWEVCPIPKRRAPSVPAQCFAHGPKTLARSPTGLTMSCTTPMLCAPCPRISLQGVSHYWPPFLTICAS
jgi:hypothetical protein